MWRPFCRVFAGAVGILSGGKGRGGNGQNALGVIFTKIPTLNDWDFGIAGHGFLGIFRMGEDGCGI